MKNYVKPKLLSLWTCTSCGQLGIGELYLKRICGSYYTSCEALISPPGWWDMVEKTLCPNCLKEEI